MPSERATSRRGSRRGFLRNCLVAGLAASAGSLPLSGSEAGLGTGSSKSRVSLAEDPLLRGAQPGSGSAVDSGRILRLLDRAMEGLYGGDPTLCWGRVARPGQRVGVKVNALGGRGLSSNVQLVEAICHRLQEAGIRAQDIVVWDRDSVELERAGFHLRTGGAAVQCYGTDRAGFTEDLESYGSAGSRLSRILTDRCDVLVNVPVLKDHDGAGVSIALKNMYGVIHNPNKYHPNGCDPFVADVNMLPGIRSKLRLHVCDATAACYEGGPAFKPEFVWRRNALIVSEDPVALDTVGWREIERKRAEKGLKTLEAEGRAPRYIATAADAEHRLGTNDAMHIALIEARST
jgi:uncharacterized protein (DUF362 family)